MISRLAPSFRACFDRLPVDAQTQARSSYRLFQDDPYHNSLHFKEVGPDIYSARVSRGYRVLGRRYGNTIIWFWIGTHAEYDRLIG